MAAHSEDVDLSANFVHDVQVFDAALVDDLDRDLLVGNIVLGD